MKLKDLRLLPKRKAPYTRDNQYIMGYNEALRNCGEVEIGVDVRKINKVLREIPGDECWLGLKSYIIEDGRLAQAIATALPTILRGKDKPEI